MTQTRPSQATLSLFKPNKHALVAAVAFMILAPLLLATLYPVGRATVSSKILWVFPTAVGLFATGWLLVGATLRPYNSILRGVIAAAVLYILIGVVWLFGLNMAWVPLL